jgi:crotonobetainyl-CoA:carnitine CoA-transferase CaiB-like acyl-CoA transferase
VVEYGVFHAGPGACAILGDLGAEVVKIEAELGDPERYWTRVGDVDFSLPGGGSLMFEFSNRNKKGIHLDIARPEGREVFHRLVRNADVFLTNLRKSTKEKMGLDYATLCGVNPKIIHANVSGYGPEGPVSDMGAFDPMGQARSGMMFATGSREPTLIHLGVLDQATAVATSHAILAALFSRERTGQGQEVHVSLYSTALWLLHANLMAVSMLSVDPSIPWERSRNSPLRNAFLCGDGKWVIGVHHPEEKYWPTFCEVMGLGHLLEDPRFSDETGRKQRNEELISLFDIAFATRTRDEWMELLPARGLMFCPVQRLQEVLEDPQARINDYLVRFDHPSLGPLRLPGYPAHFSGSWAGIRSKAPAIGEHTEEVLRDVGMNGEEIRTLRTKGVVR